MTYDHYLLPPPSPPVTIDVLGQGLLLAHGSRDNMPVRLALPPLRECDMQFVWTSMDPGLQGAPRIAHSLFGRCASHRSLSYCGRCGESIASGGSNFGGRAHANCETHERWVERGEG